MDDRFRHALVSRGLRLPPRAGSRGSHFYSWARWFLSDALDERRWNSNAGYCEKVTDTPTRHGKGWHVAAQAATLRAVVAFEWELEQFTRLRLDDEVEILMDKQARRALVLWPWYKQGEPEVDKAMWHAQAQGFEVISEVGNIIGYRIPEVDNEDWEFILMEPQ